MSFGFFQNNSLPEFGVLGVFLLLRPALPCLKGRRRDPLTRLTETCHCQWGKGSQKHFPAPTLPTCTRCAKPQQDALGSPLCCGHRLCGKQTAAHRGPSGWKATDGWRGAGRGPAAPGARLSSLPPAPPGRAPARCCQSPEVSFFSCLGLLPAFPLNWGVGSHTHSPSSVDPPGRPRPSSLWSQEPAPPPGSALEEGRHGRAAILLATLTLSLPWPGCHSSHCPPSLEPLLGGRSSRAVPSYQGLGGGEVGLGKPEYPAQLASS